MEIYMNICRMVIAATLLIIPAQYSFAENLICKNVTKKCQNPQARSISPAVGKWIIQPGTGAGYCGGLCIVKYDEMTIDCACPTCTKGKQVGDCKETSYYINLNAREQHCSQMGVSDSACQQGLTFELRNKSVSLPCSGECKPTVIDPTNLAY